MRIGVFRAAADGRRTAARLADLGHEAILAPVLHIVATGAAVDAGTADALVFTSAHAPEALAKHPDGITHLSHLPCWCVGARTAEAARLAGFTRLRTGAGDAISLVGMIAAQDRTTRLILVAGRDRKPDLETGLAQAGLAFSLVEAYAADAVSEWPEAIVARLSNMQGALHYSRRSADLAFGLAEFYGLGAHVRAAVHYCLSDDIRLALLHLGVDRVEVATRPDEASLLTLLSPS